MLRTSFYLIESPIKNHDIVVDAKAGLAWPEYIWAARQCILRFHSPDRHPKDPSALPEYAQGWSAPDDTDASARVLLYCTTCIYRH